MNAPTDPRHDEADALEAMKAALAKPRTLTHDELRNFALGQENPDGTRRGAPADIAALRMPRSKRGRPRDADREGKRPTFPSSLQRRIYVAIDADPAKRTKAKATRVLAGDGTRQKVTKYVIQYWAEGIDRRRWVSRMMKEPGMRLGEATIRQTIKKLGF